MVRKGRQNRALDQGRRRLFLAVCIKNNQLSVRRQKPGRRDRLLRAQDASTLPTGEVDAARDDARRPGTY